MANVNAPSGLVPVRHMLGVPMAGTVRPYYVAATYATALFIGDPVIIVAGGSNTAAVRVPGAGDFAIGTLPSIEKATAGTSNRITGAIVGFSPLATDLEKKHNAASTERVAYVCDDPFVVFEIQADGAVTAANIGLNANLIYTQAGSATTGLSGVELDTSGLATTAGLQVKILRAVNREDNDTTLTRARVEVLNNQPTHSPGTVGSAGV